MWARAEASLNRPPATYRPPDSPSTLPTVQGSEGECPRAAGGAGRRWAWWAMEAPREGCASGKGAAHRAGLRAWECKRAPQARAPASRPRGACRRGTWPAPANRASRGLRALLRAPLASPVALGGRAARGAMWGATFWRTTWSQSSSALRFCRAVRLASIPAGDSRASPPRCSARMCVRGFCEPWLGRSKGGPNLPPPPAPRAPQPPRRSPADASQRAASG